MRYANGRRPSSVVASAAGAQSVRYSNGRRPSSCGVRVEVGFSVRVRVRVRVRSHAIRCWDACAAGAPRTHPANGIAGPIPGRDF